MALTSLQWVAERVISRTGGKQGQVPVRGGPQIIFKRAHSDDAKSNTDTEGSTKEEREGDEAVATALVVVDVGNVADEFRQQLIRRICEWKGDGDAAKRDDDILLEADQVVEVVVACFVHNTRAVHGGQFVIPHCAVEALVLVALELHIVGKRRPSLVFTAERLGRKGVQKVVDPERVEEIHEEEDHDEPRDESGEPSEVE